MTSPGGSGPGPPWSKSSIKKKEKWLVTRKTWRYMADAGKLLIPESLRKGKDIKEYSDVDISNLDEHFQEVCDQQQDFIEWEGPRQDPRVLLAGNRAPAATNSNTWGISDQFLSLNLFQFSMFFSFYKNLNFSTNAMFGFDKSYHSSKKN